MVVSGILFSVMQPIADTVVFEDPAAILSRLATLTLVRISLFLLTQRTHRLSPYQRGKVVFK